MRPLAFTHDVLSGTRVHEVAVSPDSRYAYLAAGTGVSLLSVLDLERGEIVAERALDREHGITSLAPQR